MKNTFKIVSYNSSCLEVIPKLVIFIAFHVCLRCTQKIALDEPVIPSTAIFG